MESTLYIDSTLKEDEFDALNDETFGAAEAWNESDDGTTPKTTSQEPSQLKETKQEEDAYDALNDETFGAAEAWVEDEDIMVAQLEKTVKEHRNNSQHIDDIVNNSIMQLGLDEEPKSFSFQKPKENVPVYKVVEMNPQSFFAQEQPKIPFGPPPVMTAEQLEDQMRKLVGNKVVTNNPPKMEEPNIEKPPPNLPIHPRGVMDEQQIYARARCIPQPHAEPHRLPFNPRYPPPNFPFDRMDPHMVRQMHGPPPFRMEPIHPMMEPRMPMNMINQGPMMRFGPHVQPFPLAPNFASYPRYMGPPPMPFGPMAHRQRFPREPLPRPHMRMGPPHQRMSSRDIETFGFDAVQDHIGRNECHAVVLPKKDPYSGLMTEREKEFVIKVQMLSLNLQTPSEQDYYYLEYMKRKSQGKAVFRNKLLTQRFGHLKERPKEVQQFENSLGKLHSYTAHAPKKILDMSGSKKLDDGEGRTVPANTDLLVFRKLLMDTEKAFSIVLDLEHSETPKEDGVVLAEKFIKDVASVFERFLTVRKGRLLLMRGMVALWRLNDYRKVCLDIIISLFENLESLLQKQKNLCDSVLVERFDLFEEILKDCTSDEIFEIKQALMRNAGGINVLSEDFAQLVLEKLDEIE